MKTGDAQRQLPFLTLKNLSKDYFEPRSHKRLQILKEINLQTGNGEFVCVLGKSGCGKSTLLKLLAGFITPSKGEILLQGHKIQGPGIDKGVVFQEDALFPWLTVTQNIAFGLPHSGIDKKEWGKEIEQFLEMTELSPFRNYRPKELSGGMKQRVALARVLILKPQLLLMDEPFAALDAFTREKMQLLLLTLRRHFAPTVFFVTHDISEAVFLADTLIILADTGLTVFPLSMPHPRTMTSESFQRTCTLIKNMIISP